MTEMLTQLLRPRQGPTTAELVQEPGRFGLGRVPSRVAPVATARSVCGFCATGCGLKVHLGPVGNALNLSPDSAYPVNLGMACPKGWEALAPLAATDRATTPLLRDPASGELRPTDWSTALNTFAARMKAVQEKHGKHSISFLSTGQIPTEEMALLGALFKFGMGGLHADSNTRQCMATAATAYKQAFGFDAPPYTYADFEESDVLVFMGANPAIAHPIMWQRVMRNPHDPRIVVIDPRRTETAMAATDHYAVAPKGDLWLLYGVTHELITRGWIDRDFVDAHTTGFAELSTFIADYSPERCATESGISAKRIRELATMIHRGKAVSFWWTMGVNQGHQSTRLTHALINLALLTGNIGRPGTGANSITGQCNAMGSRLFGNTTSLLGGRDFANPQHRADVAHLLAIPEEVIPSEPSLAYDQIIDGIESGTIRGLWVIATNPAHSWIHQGRFAALREKLDFLVVQDMYATTETARIADLVLPAAGWGEKDGTFVNSERRIGVTRKVTRAPGQALADFSIFKLIAEAWGCGAMFEAWSSPEATFKLLARLSADQPCDFSGITDYPFLQDAGGIQWPYPASSDRVAPPANTALNRLAPARPTATADVYQERRLFNDGRFFTPDQRARLLFEAPAPAPESPDESFPFWLNTGRGSSAQWHTGTRTDKSPVLRKLAPKRVYVEINPDDAAQLGIHNAEPVTIRSRRASITATAAVTPTVAPGQVFMPMHFAGVNQLTYAAFDPHSRQPSYKACAVSVGRT
ncbi:molybdopterin oxidoreductase family protein [Actomonas aquatica]|uniref:Nitrate reductase n=1 Tax=Actomonas aquatica TaxID=2866162 RepID=A0ABZ1CBS5_9BACT|nr:nitrate reductase [Opitutus sp. WL0086]WRQ89029.1 nitrate reductase [Opitutus sp. WL0086]